MEGTTTPIVKHKISMSDVLCIGFLEEGESKFDAYTIVAQTEENYEQKIKEVNNYFKQTT